MLQKVHTGHMGIGKCKQRARDIMFWPGMSKCIETMVKKCSTCQEHLPANTKEPMIPHRIPDRPWQVVGTDIFSWRGENYIITVDYYSRFFELDRITSTTSSSIIHKLKAAFARHGIPEVVVSDNGPQYASKEFETFSQTWEFKHTTASPHYPQSNGLAERTVKTAKSLMDKARANGRDPYLSLLEYRNMPVDNFRSPAQLLMSRRLRSVLPSTKSQLQPEIVSYKDGHAKWQQRQQYQKRYYDTSSKPLPPLHSGECVRVQEQGRWKPAVIIQPADTERSYILRTHDGQMYRRNLRHLRTTTEDCPDNGISSADTEHKEHTPCSPEENTHKESPSLPNTHTPELLTNTASYHTKSGREVKTRSMMDL